MTEQTSQTNLAERKETNLQTTEANDKTLIKARELVVRLRYMIVNGNKLADGEVFALAQYAAANDLNPFASECYYLPGTGPVPGIAGWRKKAQEQMDFEAKALGSKEQQGFWTVARACFPGEATFEAEKGDVAIYVTLHDSITNRRWRQEYLKMAKELMDLKDPDYFKNAKEMVGPEPVWTGVGVVYSGEKFSADGKPEKYSRHERAEKRAEKIALRKRFPRVNLPEPKEIIDADAIDVRVYDTPAPEPVKRTEAQNLKELGFEPEPAKQSEQSTARMSIEAAESEWSSSSDAAYGSLPSDMLRNFQHGLKSTKKDLTDEQKRKLDAIEVILAARSAGRPVQTAPEPEPAIDEVDEGALL